MKKLFFTVLVIMLCTLLLTACASSVHKLADKTPTPEIDPASLIITEYFKFDLSTGTLLGFNETVSGVTDIVIPTEIDGYTVTNIAYGAFTAKNLTSVILPDNLITISTNAFLQNNLSELIIPNSVTEIGINAFNGNKLTSVILPDKLEKIRLGAFMGNLLTEIVIPPNVTLIESNAFRKNKLESIEFNDIIERIDGHAFEDNKLTTLTLPASLKDIGLATESGTSTKFNDRYTFSDNALTSVTILGSDTQLSSFMMGDNNNFKIAYSAGGAGTYTGTQTGEWKKVD